MARDFSAGRTILTERSEGQRISLAIRRTGGMRLLPSLWFPHLPPTTFDLPCAACRLLSPVFLLTPFLFINIVAGEL